MKRRATFEVDSHPVIGFRAGVFSNGQRRVDAAELDGTTDNSAFGIQAGSFQADTDVHVLVAGAADREATLGFEVLGEPRDVTHDVAHVHVHVEPGEVDGEHDQRLPRRHLGQPCPVGLQFGPEIAAGRRHRGVRWIVFAQVSQEEVADDGASVPGFGEGQDFR